MNRDEIISQLVNFAKGYAIKYFKDDPTRITKLFNNVIEGFTNLRLPQTKDARVMIQEMINKMLSYITTPSNQKKIEEREKDKLKVIENEIAKTLQEGENEEMTTKDIKQVKRIYFPMLDLMMKGVVKSNLELKETALNRIGEITKKVIPELNKIDPKNIQFTDAKVNKLMVKIDLEKEVEEIQEENDEIVKNGGMVDPRKVERVNEIVKRIKEIDNELSKGVNTVQTGIGKIPKGIVSEMKQLFEKNTQQSRTQIKNLASEYLHDEIKKSDIYEENKQLVESIINKASSLAGGKINEAKSIQGIEEIIKRIRSGAINQIKKALQTRQQQIIKEKQGLEAEQDLQKEMLEEDEQGLEAEQDLQKEMLEEEDEQKPPAKFREIDPEEPELDEFEQEQIEVEQESKQKALNSVIQTSTTTLAQHGAPSNFYSKLRTTSKINPLQTNRKQVDTELRNAIHNRTTLGTGLIKK